MSKVQIDGVYQGYSIKLFASSNTIGSNLNPNRYIHVELTVPPSMEKFLLEVGRDIGYSWDVEELMRILNPKGLKHRLKGRVKIKAAGQRIEYFQRGLEEDVSYLDFLIDFLANLLNGYIQVLDLGGEAVSALKIIAVRHRNSVLCPIASQLLNDIANETKNRLSHQADSLVCQNCLVHPTAQKIWISWRRTITYYGCHICGQSRAFLENRVTAVLDSEMVTERSIQDRNLWVNWLSFRQLFDFSEVQILQATDYDVEGFAVQVGNDTDKKRRKRYKQMNCIVAADCELSENSMRVLRHIFERVKVQS